MADAAKTKALPPSFPLAPQLLQTNTQPPLQSTCLQYTIYHLAKILLSVHIDEEERAVSPAKALSDQSVCKSAEQSKPHTKEQKRADGNETSGFVYSNLSDQHQSTRLYSSLFFVPAKPKYPLQIFLENHHS